MSITKLEFLAAVALGTALLGQPAAAQAPKTRVGPKIALTSLTAQGFEIKAAVSSGGNLQLVFLQKGKDVYTCITAHLADNEPWKSDCYPVQ